MRLAPVQIVGGCYADETRPYSSQDCVNWIPERAEVPGGRSAERLLQAPGLTLFSSGTGAVRGLRNVEGSLFAVIGETLYSVDSSGNKTSLGTIPGSGRVSMTHNQITGGNQLVIVNGSQGYVYNTSTLTLTQISDDAYEGGIIADYLASYILQVEPTRRYWFHSDLANALEYISLDRYEGEAAPDRIVSLLVDHGEVWLLNERTIEIFINAPTESAAFQRSSGSSIEIGCAGLFTPAKTDNGVFWLGNDGIFYRANGYNPTRISTHAIEQAIQGLDWSQAYSTVWEDKGHKVVYWTFPDGLTWGYDVATGLWHRRKSYGINNWRVNHLVQIGGRWIAGDAYSGNLYVVDWAANTENGEEIERIRTTGVLHADTNRFRVDMVEIECSVGTSALSNSDHTIELSWSDDGGYNFGNWHSRTLGGVGNYRTRPAWRRLGYTRERVWRIRVTSPVKCDILAAAMSMQD